MTLQDELIEQASHDPNFPSIAELESALMICARLVDRHGDQHLPTFLRIEEALAAARNRMFEQLSPE